MLCSRSSTVHKTYAFSPLTNQGLSKEWFSHCFWRQEAAGGETSPESRPVFMVLVILGVASQGSCLQDGSQTRWRAALLPSPRWPSRLCPRGKWWAFDVQVQGRGSEMWWASESRGGLVKLQMAGPHSQSFHFSGSWVWPETLHFLQVCKWCCCRCAGPTGWGPLFQSTVRFPLELDWGACPWNSVCSSVHAAVGSTLSSNVNRWCTQLYSLL